MDETGWAILVVAALLIGVAVGRGERLPGYLWIGLALGGGGFLFAGREGLLVGIFLTLGLMAALLVLAWLWDLITEH